MNTSPFAHLHCHTHYSLLDGANRIPDLVQQVKNLGMNACAITDHGNLYGALEFYQTCRASGVNPIIGYEAYMAPGQRTDRSPTRTQGGCVSSYAAGDKSHGVSEPRESAPRITAA